MIGNSSAPAGLIKMLRSIATGFRRGWKLSLLSRARNRNPSLLFIGAAGAATASVLINASLSRENSPFEAIVAHCSHSSSDQERLDEQVELYVDAILGSRMSNIPGLPGSGPYPPLPPPPSPHMYDDCRQFKYDLVRRLVRTNSLQKCHQTRLDCRR